MVLYTCVRRQVHEINHTCTANESRTDSKRLPRLQRTPMYYRYYNMPRYSTAGMSRLGTLKAKTFSCAVEKSREDVFFKDRVRWSDVPPRSRVDKGRDIDRPSENNVPWLPKTSPYYFNISCTCAHIVYIIYTYIRSRSLSFYDCCRRHAEYSCILL